MATNPLPITIAPCTPPDIPACIAIVSDTFQHHEPFVDVFFPAHDTPSGREQATARLTVQLEHDQEATLLKATTRTSDGAAAAQIVGFAIWTYMRVPPPVHLAEVEEDVATVWPDEGDQEFASRLWREYIVPRSEAVRQAEEGKGALVLELLAVHPDAQSGKVGSRLVQWGTALADEKGIEAVVESTLVAVRCYEKSGFRTTIPKMRFDVGDEFGARKTPHIAFMRRQATPKG